MNANGDAAISATPKSEHRSRRSPFAGKRIEATRAEDEFCQSPNYRIDRVIKLSIKAIPFPITRSAISQAMKVRRTCRSVGVVMPMV